MPFTFLGKVQMSAVKKCKHAVSHVNGWASIVKACPGKNCRFVLCLVYASGTFKYILQLFLLLCILGDSYTCGMRQCFVPLAIISKLSTYSSSMWAISLTESMLQQRRLICIGTAETDMMDTHSMGTSTNGWQSCTCHQNFKLPQRTDVGRGSG